MVRLLSACQCSFSNQSADCGRGRPRDSSAKEKHTGAVEEGSRDGERGEKRTSVFGEWRQKKALRESLSLETQAMIDLHHYIQSTVVLYRDKGMFTVSGFSFYHKAV